MYVHWLVVDRMSRDDKEQIQSIMDYLQSHEEAYARVFFRNSGTFEWIVRLNCKERYNDLELDVNSLSTNLRRLHSKPKDIYEVKKTFEEMANSILIR